MAVTKLIKFRGEIEKTIKKQGSKPHIFPPIKSIFEKFPDITTKSPKDSNKTKGKYSNYNFISIISCRKTE